MSTEPLRISRTHFPVTALGPGIRLGIWVQGCPHACKGCMALDTWEADTGTGVGIDALAELWHTAIRDGAGGLTISGGEPLAQPGPLRTFLAEADRIRRVAAADGAEPCDIMLYTGYELAELDQSQHLACEHVDVLVTGRFEVARPTDLIWRGSANQEMLLRTPLARRRYRAYLEQRPASPPLQVRVDDRGVWLVGVPRRGTLARLDHEFRERGLDVAAVSWRPGPAHRTDNG